MASSEAPGRAQSASKKKFASFLAISSHTIEVEQANYEVDDESGEELLHLLWPTKLKMMNQMYF